MGMMNFYNIPETEETNPMCSTTKVTESDGNEPSFSDDDDDSSCSIQDTRTASKQCSRCKGSGKECSRSGKCRECNGSGKAKRYIRSRRKPCYCPFCRPK